MKHLMFEGDDVQIDTLSVDVSSIARQLSAEDDETQAKFFEEFFHHLEMNCSSELQVSSQLGWVAERLPQGVRARLEELVGFF